jgi:hypothetical protein
MAGRRAMAQPGKSMTHTHDDVFDVVVSVNLLSNNHDVKQIWLTGTIYFAGEA